MDIFVLPSYREGFGMSVIEASAMRVPVIVTEYPGPSSAMINGKTGIAIPVKDSKSIENAILRLINNVDLAKEMGNNGRKYVEQSFEQKEFIRKHIEHRLAMLK